MGGENIGEFVFVFVFAFVFAFVFVFVFVFVFLRFNEFFCHIESMTGEPRCRGW